jgi:CubicO group peptidase (beta-lactamase class C family)
MVFTSIASVTAQTSPTQPDLQAIDAYIQTEMRNDRVPGVALALIHNGKVVALRGYGDDGYGRPVTPQTSFWLGSMSKSFTALAVMQLVEQGKIDLDAPVQSYLPWFRVADPAQSAVITVRHLLNHTSGIPTSAPQAANANATLQDHVRALAHVTLRQLPGVQHQYASPNYLVLGAIIEAVTGQGYADYIQQQIFTPLDMQHSYTDQRVAIAQGMAQGQRYWFGFPVPATLPYEQDRMPTAALISSAEDLGKYMIMQLNAGRYAEQQLLSPAGMAQLHTPSAPSDDFSYAFGWRVSTIGGVPAIHHGGIVPHFRGKMVLLPEQGWGVAVLTNASTSFPLPILPTSHRMADAIAGYLVGQPFSSGAFSQSTVYLAITVGLALVLLNQLKGLVQIGRWRKGLAQRTPVSMFGELVSEVLWPFLAIFGLPALLALPLEEIMRGTPDLGWWLIISVALGIMTAVAKAWALWQHTRQSVSRSMV